MSALRLLLACLALFASGRACAQAQITVRKPLTLASTRNLVFGDITFGVITAPETVSVTTGGGRVCGTSGRLTCAGTFSTAQFRVTGSNGQVALISTATPTIVMTSNTGGNLVLTPVLPVSVTIPNSGNQGVLFEVGGRIAITPTAPEGTYSGVLDVTVIYQ